MHKDHPNLTPEVNNAIQESELAGGIWWRGLPVGSVVQVQTANTLYRLEKREDGDYISGNQKYCPEPTKVSIHGSTWGGSMLKIGFLGMAMYLEFSVEGHGTITTSLMSNVERLL